MTNDISIEDAARRLAGAQRILVIGCSGGGKSTLAQALASRFGLEYQSIDRDVRWIAGWNQRPREEQRRIISELVTRERWVMDGSNPSSFDIRLNRADLVIWVRMPRLVCLMGIARRVWRYRGTTRPEMAEGCPEPLPDREFLDYIWNFEKKSAPIFVRNIALYGPQTPVVMLKSRADTKRLLDLGGFAA